MSKPGNNPVKIRLSDTQLIALSNASQRRDGAIELPDRIKGAATVKLVTALTEKGLAREIRAKAGMPVARRDGEGRSFALVITKLGRTSINVGEEARADRDPVRQLAEPPANAPPVKRPRAANASAPRKTAALATSTAAANQTNAPRDIRPDEHDVRGKALAATPTTGMPREGSKLANIIGLLDRPDGASIDDLTLATNWLPHTTRAVLTGLRKRGLNVERSREDGVTRYRIIAPPRADTVGSGRAEALASADATEREAEAA
ncbi:MAG: DUF3489 domain-containing protein [Roseiarcus sp.]|jgi:hypothetical protein